MKKLITTTRETSIEDAVQEAMSEVESLRDEMSEWRDNMEEKLSHTEKYERVSECADNLDNVQEIDIPDEYRETKITVISQRKSSRKSPYPRWLRLQNAVGALTAAKDVLEEMEDDDAEGVRDQFVSDLGDAIDNLEGVEFPGMFG